MTEIREKHIEVIRGLPLWQGSSSLSVQDLKGGITNFNYLVETGGKKYVARFGPKDGSLLGLDRQREIENTKIAYKEGIGPEFVEYYPEYNLLIIRYIEGLIFAPEIVKEHNHIQSVAELLRKLHQGEKFSGAFNPFEISRKYIATAKERQSWLPENISLLLKDFEKIENTLPTVSPSPGHFDLVMGNFVENEGSIKLIDWEYSANGDYRFDLASVSVYGEFERKHEEILLEAYGDEDFSYSQFQKMKAVVAFREAAWGVLQLAISEIEYDYQGSAGKYFFLFEKFSNENE